MSGLIPLIIIAVFVFKVIKNAEVKNGKKSAKNTVTRQQRPRQNTYQRTGQSQRNAQQSMNYYNQQKATKERLQQKYKSQQKPEQKGDILSRAKGNVNEYEPSKMRQELHAEACRDYRDTSHNTTDVIAHKMQSPECDTGMESDIMKKVNDLIVTGYSGNLTFERDFIAEGVDMLNRFSL